VGRYSRSKRAPAAVAVLHGSTSAGAVDGARREAQQHGAMFCSLASALLSAITAKSGTTPSEAAGTELIGPGHHDIDVSSDSG